MAEVKYSTEFVDKVKRVYPDFKEMHERADNNDYFLGRYLCDSSPQGVSISSILSATSLEELKAYAKECQERIDLYKEWGYEVQKNS